jgi:hypothetical protein
MAKRRKGHRTKRRKGSTLYGRCLSKQLTGKHPRTKKARSALMKRVQRKCKHLR